jgi:hypothetical protein
MVVDNPDLPRFGSLPTEDDPPSAVDPDAMEAGEIPSQRLELDASDVAVAYKQLWMVEDVSAP